MAPSVPALRRLLSCFAGGGNGPPSALEPATKKKSLVFMGSPQVSASVLGALLDTSTAPNSSFQVAAIVTQPPSTRDRDRKLMPSAVAQFALDWGFPKDLILTPDRTGDENFLANFRLLNPELCVTAAYGNILPNKFLEIPPYGTVNIHPSLLPLYRGAAPVQRALQDGVKETGVSLAYTVRALDSGPIIACERVEVDDCIKAPELLTLLFDLGSKILIREVPSIFDGSAKLKAKAQDDSKATLAPKLTTDESWLSFDREAKILHNKVRAFAGWPGTRARIQVIDGNGNPSTIEIKVFTTRVSSPYERQSEAVEITFAGNAMVIPCAGQSALEVLELQLPGKKVMTARDFQNGLRGLKLRRLV